MPLDADTMLIDATMMLATRFSTLIRHFRFAMLTRHYFRYADFAATMLPLPPRFLLRHADALRF